MGHSFGGVTSVLAGLTDFENDVAGVVGLDSWLFPMDD